MWQIGVLRAIGLNQKELHTVTLMECSSTILSASILGFITGYIVCIVSISVLQQTQSLPVDYSIDWSILLIVLLSSYIIVILATKVCINALNKKEIT